MNKRHALSRVIACAAVAIMFVLANTSGFAQRPMASPVPMPSITMPQAAPSLPQAAPSYNSSIPTIPDQPSAVAAPPAVEAAPYGIHRSSDGKWALDPGCHWVDPDDEDDLRATCG